MSSRFLVALAALAIACGASPSGEGTRAASTPSVEVYKTATCGCCGKWVEHMRAAGFNVRYTDVEQAALDKLKAKHGIPRDVHSCHTALVDGYAIEGHVPASEVKRLLKERPAVVGIAVPGMPLGSPGMEVSGVKPHPYDVLTFDKQGRTKVYSTQRP